MHESSHAPHRRPTKLSIEPNSDDIVIAVMGITGCGKTTFVNHFSDEALVIGHGLDSCTQTVQPAACIIENGVRIFLVDTPGFDDSSRSDTEILGEVAFWLNEAHKSQIKLTGIILLHRIIDARVGGTGHRNIRMFKKLCGDDGLESVVLATTMWDILRDETVGQDREKNLIEEEALWRPMIQLGSRMFRHDDGRTSALAIIKYLIEKRRPVVLDIQTEMIDQRKNLGQTTAGNELRSEAERFKQYQDLELQNLEIRLQEALLKHDYSQKECIEVLKSSVLEQLEKRKLDIQRLKADSDQLREEVRLRYEGDLKQLRQELMQSHVEDLKKQKLQVQRRMKEQYFNMMYGPKQCSVM